MEILSQIHVHEHVLPEIVTTCIYYKDGKFADMLIRLTQGSVPHAGPACKSREVVEEFVVWPLG